MTDATSVTRYEVGGAGTAPVELRYTGTACQTGVSNGYVCNLETGHGGPQHLAIGAQGRVYGTADRDEVEGTWKPGDVVMRTSYPRIGIGAVLHVGRDGDGPVQVWLCAKDPGDEAFRLLLVTEPDTLRPYEAGTVVGDYEPPTLAEIGEALVWKAAVLDEAVKEVRAERDRAQDEHNEFRDTVRDTAIRLAREHNWCSVVDGALREMGLEPMRRSYDVQVTITATRTITVRADEVDFDGMDTSEVHDALGWSRVDGAFREQESESGWSTSEYEVVEWEATED
jgi:hypothetical protein